MDTAELIELWDAQAEGGRLSPGQAARLAEIDAQLGRLGDPAELRSLIRQGWRMREASRHPRRDRLTDLTTQAALTLYNNTGRWPTADEVLSALWRHDARDEWQATLQEIDTPRRAIYWVDRRGREQTTSFDAFAKRLKRIRHHALSAPRSPYN
jgi:hypothetical protein